MDGDPTDATDGPAILQRSRLGQLTKIASGGQGTAYRAPGVQLGFAPSAVFKEYKPHVLGELDIAQLTEMPRFLLALSGATALKLVGICAWPCAIVRDGDRTVGFVMPEIPDRFRVDMTTVRGAQRRIAEFQHLLNSDEYLAQRGIPLSDGDRYRLIAAVASELAFMHSLGIAVGDMSPKNMMFSLHPEAAIYFIDTDAMRVRGKSVSPQMESPGWAVPAGDELATSFTDRYKLGLLALRLLVGDHDASDPRTLPAATPRQIVELVTRSLATEPATRPAPSDWFAAATTAAKSANQQPAAVTGAPPTVAGPHTTGRAGAPSGPMTPPRPRPTPPAQPAFSAAKPTPPKGSSNAALGWITAAVVALLVVVGAVLAVDSRSSSETSMATTTTSRYPTYSSPTTTTTRTTTTTTTAARTSEAPPSRAQSCSTTLYYVNEVTTCGFARNVYLAMTRSELPKLYTGISSPARSDRTFDMFCRYTSVTSRLVICTGGDDATVYIP